MSRRDRIRESFLEQQLESGMAVARASDLLELYPIREALDAAPERYIARFFSTGLVRGNDGVVRDANRFDVGIWFHDEFQRRVDPMRVVTLIHPKNTWHPNVEPPFICIGRISCATTLADILHQVWEILSFRKWAAHDALNKRASQWARNNQHRFPTDPRALLSGPGSFEVSLLGDDSEDEQ